MKNKLQRRREALARRQDERNKWESDTSYFNEQTTGATWLSDKERERFRKRKVATADQDVANLSAKV